MLERRNYMEKEERIEEKWKNEKGSRRRGRMKRIMRRRGAGKE
jgi:hypothetical protein